MGVQNSAIMAATASKSDSSTPPSECHEKNKDDPNKNSEDESFLSVKFEKLIVSPSSCQTQSGLSQSKVLLKSEKDVLKLRKKAKNKKIVQKSKLGESFQKFRDGLEDIPAGDTKPLVFGRKYSFSLENFNSLSLQEDSSENSAKFSSESFKHINVRSARRGLCQIFNASSCCRVLGENV